MLFIFQFSSLTLLLITFSQKAVLSRFTRAVLTCRNYRALSFLGGVIRKTLDGRLTDARRWPLWSTVWFRSVWDEESPASELLLSTLGALRTETETEHQRKRSGVFIWIFTNFVSPYPLCKQKNYPTYFLLNYWPAQNMVDREVLSCQEADVSAGVH